MAQTLPLLKSYNQRREALGMSINGLARAAGVTASTIQLIGDPSWNPLYVTIELLDHALGIEEKSQKRTEKLANAKTKRLANAAT